VAQSFRFAPAVLFLAAIAAAAPESKEPSAEQIQKAIEELASPRFAVRERASKLLWEAGSAAEPALREATKNKDEETANRAKGILDKFDWGLYPDTPAEVVKLIEKFRGGDTNVRQEAVAELIRLKPPRFATLRKLIAQEQDENARAQMQHAMAFQARQAVPGLILAGQLDEANDLLVVCIAPGNTNSLSDYAALQHLRGRVPEAIKRMEALQKKGPESETKRAAEALVYLHRLRKDWPAARKAVAAAKNPELENDLAWESDDWATLAKGGPLQPGETENRGAKAAYFRLAGDTVKYQELIAELRKDLAGVEGDDSAAAVLADALLKNGQGADAIAVLKDRSKRGADLVFDLLCAQLKFKEAFTYADQATKELEKDEEAVVERDQLAIRKAKILAALGDKDAATQVFRGALDKVLTPNADRSAVLLVRTVARTGMRDLAAECAARCLAHFEKLGRGDEASYFLDPVFEDKKHVVKVWWRALRKDKPDEDPVATMNRVKEFVDGKADRKKVDRLAELVEKNKGIAPGLTDGTSSRFLIAEPGINHFAVAEAYRAIAANDKAEEFFKKATSGPSPFGSPFGDSLPGGPFQPNIELPDDEDLPWSQPSKYKFLLSYADFLMTRKRPKEAAALYRQAWDANSVNPLPLFLQGHALKLAGNAAEGERLMGIAHWMPLGNESLRTKFSEELSKRGFDADSRREMDLVLETGWFRTHYVGNVYLRLARIKARQKDYATAAKYYEKDVVSLFRTGAMFVDDKALLTVPELARTYRARALLAAGKLDEAIADARAGLAVLPGNVEMAIGLVPDLDRAGKNKEADEIYGKVKEAFVSALETYGTSADLRNSLAWTMVNCNRDLDDALAHATKAVELAPKSAGYIDTLAEVCFRKKDRAKALELMKQCAALEPTNPYFRKQLERFEKKPFDSPLPDEETGDDD
jgi:tetratricopeptide (TPR) repeat protein